MSQLSQRLNAQQLVDNYTEKFNLIYDIVKDIISKDRLLRSVCLVGTPFGNSPELLNIPLPSEDVQDDINEQTTKLQKKLLLSAWNNVVSLTHAYTIMPSVFKSDLDAFLLNPPKFSVETIKDFYIKYIASAEDLYLRAFAKIFCSLDPFYKSHCNFKVGNIKGLPNRLIISNAMCSYYNTVGMSRLTDIYNLLIQLKSGFLRIDGIADNEFNPSIWQDGNPKLESYRLFEFLRDNLGKKCALHGIGFKPYKNGNVHILFDPESLRYINLCLNKYYDSALYNDAYDDKPNQKQPSTEVAKNLQFFATPEEIAKDVASQGLDYVRRKTYPPRDETPDNEVKILEPSCGEGALLDALVKENNNRSLNSTTKLDITGVEVNFDRANVCRKKGYKVHCCNFLSWDTTHKYDLIIMNPPFYGTHYMKHIKKAYSLLRDNGMLISIVPSAARYKHQLIQQEFDVYTDCPQTWRDQVVGSFLESGTTINTTIFKIVKQSF